MREEKTTMTKTIAFVFALALLSACGDSTESIAYIDPSGEQGPAGQKGETGSAGEKGPKGDTGATGPQGPVGATGATGAQGPKGATGATGPQGPIGLTGAQGLTGPKGDTGPVGPQGAKGETGPQGPIGPQGPQGPRGLAGADGPQGPQGIPGVCTATCDSAPKLRIIANPPKNTCHKIADDIWIWNTGTHVWFKNNSACDHGANDVNIYCARVTQYYNDGDSSTCWVGKRFYTVMGNNSALKIYEVTYQ